MSDEQLVRRVAGEMIHEFSGDSEGPRETTFGQPCDRTRGTLHHLAAATQDEITDMRCASVLAAREGDLEFAAWLARGAHELEAVQQPGLSW